MEHPRSADSAESFATIGADKRNSTRTIASSGTTRLTLRPKCADGISIEPPSHSYQHVARMCHENTGKSLRQPKKLRLVVTLKSRQISSPVWAVSLHVKARSALGLCRLPNQWAFVDYRLQPAHNKSLNDFCICSDFQHTAIPVRIRVSARDLSSRQPAVRKSNPQPRLQSSQRQMFGLQKLQQHVESESQVSSGCK